MATKTIRLTEEHEEKLERLGEILGEKTQNRTISKCIDIMFDKLASPKTKTLSQVFGDPMAQIDTMIDNLNIKK